MKNGIKMTAVLLLSSAAFLSAAGTVSAAADGSLSAGTSIKRTVLAGEAPTDGCDVNGDGTVDVLDLMRLKFNHLNPADPESEAGKLVFRLYRTVLLTEPDRNEALELTAKLENKETTAAALVLDFMKRPEYVSRDLPDDEFVTLMYNTFLGREPDETGYGNWTEKANYFSRDYIMRGFVISNEFTGICKNGGFERGDIELTESRDKDYEVTRSVGQMYKRITGNKPDAEKLNTITQDILDSKMTFEEVAFGLAESDEFAAVTTKGEELVKVLYYGLLDREPSEDEMKTALEGLESGVDKADLVRKIAVTESFIDTYSNRSLGSHTKRIGSNYKKGDIWMHLEPSGKTYPVTDEVLLKLLDSCSSILSIRGKGVDDIYSYCIENSGYKYMEKTRTLEEIEEKGWTYFADYAMKNYFSVCYYMAAQMDILLEQAGYQCRVVHATHGSGDHYWNQIYLNGNWTNYDVTNRWRNYTWAQMYEAGDYVILGYVRPEYK